MICRIYELVAALFVCVWIGASRGCECGAGGGAGGRRAPPGYRNASGLGLFKAHWEWRTWFDAKAACEREGADLVVINSQSEATMVQTLMNTYNGINYFHVGFFDVTADGTYVTVLGEPLASSGYSEWARGEPSQVGRENCGAIHKENGLSDVLCKRELPFLCELPQ